MRRTKVIGALVLIVALVTAGWIGKSIWSHAKQSASPADATDITEVAAGQEVYVANCASCHGDKLQGQPNWSVRNANGKLPAPPHDTTGHTWHHPDQQLFKIIKLGSAAIVPNYKTDMIGFGNKLSDRDIWNVIAYIKSTWPPEIQARQARMTRAAADQGLDANGSASASP